MEKSTMGSMTEAEADELAAKKNREVVRDGDDGRYFVPVQDEHGGWRVDEQRDKPGWFSRLLDAMPFVP